MPRPPWNQPCACGCGESRFALNGPPISRFLCHCTICQSLYREPFADVTAFRARDLALPPDHKIQFKRYRSPPALKRGTCPSCGAPVAGFLRLAPFVAIAFVPSRNIRDQASLPKPRTHIFYHRRHADAADDLPKVSGYWPSEVAVTKLILAGLLGARRDPASNST